METSFRLTPDIHSYNALLCAFGKLDKRDETVNVFEHLVSLGVKPNAKSYALLIDAHLIKRDPKAALSTVNGMVSSDGVGSLIFWHLPRTTIYAVFGVPLICSCVDQLGCRKVDGGFGKIMVEQYISIIITILRIVDVVACGIQEFLSILKGILDAFLLNCVCLV